MNAATARKSDESIRREVRRLRRYLLARRDELSMPGVSGEELVRVSPELIVKLRDFRIERRQELPTQSIEQRGFATVETAGLLDRQARTIFIAKKFPLPEQRFTLGHEIGHLELHPDLSYHRDRPISGFTSTRLPPEEHEANIFAAELLMPEALLRKVFAQCFGEPFDGRFRDTDVAFKLSSALGRQVTADRLCQMMPFQRALLFAKVDSFGLNLFGALSTRFGVTPTAMAIELVRLGLVA